MNKFDRIFDLHKILQARHTPISTRELMARLECADPTVRRLIAKLRDELGAPVRFDRARGGWVYDATDAAYELPGLWFSATELQALLASHQWLTQIEPGLLGGEIAPLVARLERLLEQQQPGGGQLRTRIKLIALGARAIDDTVFRSVVGTLAEGCQLAFTYQGRIRNDQTRRSVSPLRLTWYKSNWYLDAWCHLRSGLRSFALDRISARELGRSGDESYLWLHLHDGRVLAFLLAQGAVGNNALIQTILTAVANDPRGLLEIILLPTHSMALPLYAAPAAPMSTCAWGHPQHAAARAFAAKLNQDALHLLALLDTHRFWSSARNYNRLAALPGEAGTRRIQAVARFPLLAAPIVLTAHHGSYGSSGKRHAWRNHDDAVIDAIEHGRNLSGALAAHYGISKSLVCAPVCSEMWGDTGIAHTRLLHMLDGIPAHRRPASWHALERSVAHLPALERLVGENSLATLGQSTFKSGWNTVWDACEARYPQLSHVLDDTHDFLRAAVAQVYASWAHTLDEAALARAWLAAHGLVSLLNASHRWHALLHARPVARLDPTRTLPAILGTYTDSGHCARELIHYDDLAREGSEMHHCVAQYWTICEQHGTRIFALVLDTGERATAEYTCGHRLDADLEFSLGQLRGICNRDVSLNMESFAQALEIRLNHPNRLPARQVLLARLEDYAPPSAAAPVALDPTSERQLTALIARLTSQPESRMASDENLRAPVAAAPPIESQPHVHQAATPHNAPYVQVNFGGHTLAYLPLPDHDE